MSTDPKAVTARISGTVQGVYYRAWTCEKATELGLAGWVRNEPDGTVTAFVEGPGDRVDTLIALFSEGSPAAEVRSVDTAPSEPAGTKDFVIKR